jgi:hypothetical protein
MRRCSNAGLQVVKLPVLLTVALQAQQYAATRLANTITNTSSLASTVVMSNVRTECMLMSKQSVG